MIIKNWLKQGCFLSSLFYLTSWSYAFEVDKVQACISPSAQQKFEHQFMSSKSLLHLLGWRAHSGHCCYGEFLRHDIPEQAQQNQIKFNAREVELTPNGCSKLNGKVTVQYNQQILQADTAYIFRDEKSGQIKRIELANNVTLLEPGKKIVAKYARFYPQTKTGHIFDAAYRVDLIREHSRLPGWGRAAAIWRNNQGIIFLKNASFSTCSPLQEVWKLKSKSLSLNPMTERGVAKHSTFRIKDIPIFYAPYLSFPISNKRQSGFLTPTVGFSNITGYDFSLPYYWNIAPNYDATIVPHAYTLRGLMLGGEFRYLIPGSNGMVVGNFLPNDQLFGKFLASNSWMYPQLDKLSKNRWSMIWHDKTQIASKIGAQVDYQRVSDDYYLQDFSSNLAVMTENQLLRQGLLDYRLEHWYFKTMLQNYQTLQPINQSFVSQLYARQPQVFAQGNYDKILRYADVQILGQYDQFAWTGAEIVPEGPRVHVNPTVTIPFRNSWSYAKPQVELVSNMYQLSHIQQNQMFNYSMAVPRYSIDSGIFMDRNMGFWQQTLEPRLFYLFVPYQNQTVVPAFESAYMIFNTDQLFRSNRFSGYDRIGDTNQFSYSLTSRLVHPYSGDDKVVLTVGQIAYLKDRRLNLCYAPDGNCQDQPIYLGYLSPTTRVSPIASRGVYNLTRNWAVIGNYIYDVNTNSTNNSDLNLHYQPAPDRVIHLGYSFLVNGNVILTPNATVDQMTLNQVSAGYAWPFSEKWSSLGAYSYNISNGFAMVMFGGVQYDSCCWAFRVIGGRVFQSMNQETIQPLYNNNVYLQILLKGVGSVANSDPSNALQTYLPGLNNIFKH